MPHGLFTIDVKFDEHHPEQRRRRSREFKVTTSPGRRGYR